MLTAALAPDVIAEATRLRMAIPPRASFASGCARIWRGAIASPPSWRT